MKPLSPRQLAALRFLAHVPWCAHPWTSVHGGILLQLGPQRGMNGARVLRQLERRGLAATPRHTFGVGLEMKITAKGQQVLAEHDAAGSKEGSKT